MYLYNYLARILLRAEAQAGLKLLFKIWFNTVVCLISKYFPIQTVSY